MVNGTAVARAVLADPALIEQFFEDTKTIVDAIERLSTVVHTLIPPATPIAAPALPAASAAAPVSSSPAATDVAHQAPPDPGSARVFDTSVQALENHDAETLVALRKDHSLVAHPLEGCHICEILARRLGSARP